MSSPKLEDFKSKVGFFEALKWMVPQKCSGYTFPGGLVAFMVVLILLGAIGGFITGIMNKDYKMAGIAAVVPIIISLPTIYINAYLIKGCQASNLIDEYNEKNKPKDIMIAKLNTK